ncbi:hypothetical protein AB0892_11750 [Streptomyces sp. NPDC005409]|uniref:hypothetical protein n=1 Tax=Streptomyces sp. NPDC005409 TaxID=3155342 RepID=UPI00345520FF
MMKLMVGGAGRERISWRWIRWAVRSSIFPAPPKGARQLNAARAYASVWSRPGTIIVSNQESARASRSLTLVTHRDDRPVNVETQPALLRERFSPRSRQGICSADEFTRAALQA